MPVLPDGFEPSIVSEEDLKKLEDELLAVFTEARPGTGAYSNHATNPSTSSLPDPDSFRPRSALPRPSSTTPGGKNPRPRPLPPTPGTSGTPYVTSNITVRSISNDSDRGRLPAPHSAIDSSFGNGLPTPVYAQGQSAFEGHSTMHQSQAWNDEANVYRYGGDSPSMTPPEYTKKDTSSYLAAPPYPYPQQSTTNVNFNHAPELPILHSMSHSLSTVDLNNPLLRPPRAQSDQPSTYASFDQSPVLESLISYTDNLPTAMIPMTRTSAEPSTPSYDFSTPDRTSGSSFVPLTQVNSDRYRHEEAAVAVPSRSDLLRRPSAVLREIMSDTRGIQQPGGPRSEQEEDAHWRGEYEDEEEDRFVNFALLSHLAVLLRDKVPRGTHVKGSVPYPRAFTGKDIVTTIHTHIKRVWNHGGSVNANDRRVALQVARSLQSQLFFYEVEWGARKLRDGVEDVYMLMDDQEGDSNAPPDREELPTSVVTVLARCYSPMCDAGEVMTCYAYNCPRKTGSLSRMLPKKTDGPDEMKEWDPPPEVFQSLPENERRRQSIIRKLIEKEEQYVHDLEIVETCFINPLRLAKPLDVLEDMDQFIDEVFLNILELRECNRRLLETMYVRQREQAPVVQRIGDILLEAASEFRDSYARYVGRHPIADKRLKDELERNPDFRLFIENCSRQQSARPGENLRLDLRHFLSRPSEHMQKYPVLLQAILKETEEGNPDVTYLLEAIEALKNLQNAAQLQTFQAAMGKGLTSRWEWQNLVSPGLRRNISDEENRRQLRIFDLIKGEMAYVKDLDSIETIYIRPLQNADPPIIPHERLGDFMQDVFYNWAELHSHHHRLVDTLFTIQREEHPRIRSVIAPVYDRALNFREAYMQYIPNYPIAEYRIEDEMSRNPIFKEFAETSVQHRDAHMLDMKGFINRPILQLLRYDELLRAILDETPRGHEDIESIPQVLDVIKALGHETEPGVISAKQKVKLWGYNAGLVFKRGETVDLDLLNENRSLMHSGKLLRQSESGTESNEWQELFVLLFDNYLVLTKPEPHQDMTKYHVYRRPIPLELLTLVHFTDPPTPRTATFRQRDERRTGSSGSSVSASEDGESRSLYPFTIQHNARLGRPHVLNADSAHSRAEWKQKLEEAMGLRKVVQESNKVFETETLSNSTFNIQPVSSVPSVLATWSEGGLITGKVTCSIPFNTPDGRSLVAIGCAEGVWIGFRRNPQSMRRVLHLPMVTQCTILDEFGLFLVLADKSLLAYHIEALVPPTHVQHTITASQAPQKLNGNKEVHFFSVGNMAGRTLVIYMRKRGTGSYFHVLEPAIDRINERSKESTGRFGLFRSKLEWFTTTKEFTLRHESFDLIFLKAKIAILCNKGFEIMDLNKLESVTIPSEDPRLEPLGNRLKNCRPIGIFRSREDEFLLCYAEFGIYVDKQGDPSRDASTIEWEGCADSVAFHAPYVLLFDPRFVEIRHIETGRLAQILPGNDIRCVWNGRGLASNNILTPGDVSDDQMIQEAQVHAVTNFIEPSVQPVGRPPKAVTQHVFELIPTIPLYLPGSLSSPSTQTYFPQLFTPHSPPIRHN